MPKMLFYNDNQILVGADVKLVKNRILAYMGYNTLQYGGKRVSML